MDYKELQVKDSELFGESELLPIVTDEESIKEFEERTGKKIGVVYESDYHKLVVDLIGVKDGFTYERLMATARKGGAVIIPRYKDKFILLKQFRHAIRENQIGFPRGMCRGDSVETAITEIAEELGGKGSEPVYMGKITPDSGILSDWVSIYLMDIYDFEKRLGFEGIKEVILLTKDEITNMIFNGEITDGFTLSAWMLAWKYL